MYINTESLREDMKIKGPFIIKRFEVGKSVFKKACTGDEIEILYVLSGEILNENGQKIKSGEMLLYKAKDGYIKSVSNTPCEVLTLRFRLSPDTVFENAGDVLKCTRREKEIILGIIEESSKKLVFASEQMIRLYTEMLLIRIKRGEVIPKQNSEEPEIFLSIIAFMEENIGKKISLDDISHYAGVSKTSVKKLFKEQAGFGACEYFTKMKIEKAKELILEEKNNFTQIAEILGYDSIHYFSRQFKQYVNMSPTEYLIKGRGQGII